MLVIALLGENTIDNYFFHMSLKTPFFEFVELNKVVITLNL